MEAGADRQARQATGPQANDSRSASPYIPIIQQAHVCVCAGLYLQATEWALWRILLLVVMTLTAGLQKSAGTVSFVAAVCISCLLPSSFMQDASASAPAVPYIPLVPQCAVATVPPGQDHDAKNDCPIEYTAPSSSVILVAMHAGTLRSAHKHAVG